MNCENTLYRESRVLKGNIEGITMLKTLVAYKGESLIHNRRIALEPVEEWSLKVLALKDTPSNRLYVCLELVNCFKERGMWKGRMIYIPEGVYERIRIQPKQAPQM